MSAVVALAVLHVALVVSLLLLLLLLLQAPLVLVIALKRYTASPKGVAKNSHHIAFSDTLDLKPCLVGSSGTSAAVYDLASVVVHTGGECNSGHTYAYVKSRSGTWFKMDDASVQSASFSKIQTESPYLLIYTLQPPKDTRSTAASAVGAPASSSVGAGAGAVPASGKAVGASGGPPSQSGVPSKPAKRAAMYDSDSDEDSSDVDSSSDEEAQIAAKQPVGAATDDSTKAAEASKKGHNPWVRGPERVQVSAKRKSQAFDADAIAVAATASGAVGWEEVEEGKSGGVAKGRATLGSALKGLDTGPMTEAQMQALTNDREYWNSLLDAGKVGVSPR